MTDTSLNTIWVYLSTSPLLWLLLTLASYCASYQLYQRSGGQPLLNPVALAVMLLMIILWLTKTPYQQYFSGAQYIHFLLGPATVALALPLYQQLAKLKKIWLSVLIALPCGVVIGAVSSVLIARLLGADIQTQLSLAPKSVTAPVAMGIAEKINGLPSLTAALVVTTGIIGALMSTTLFTLINVKDDSIKGFALGLTSHGIGTARAFQISSEMGAFAGLAMALSTIVTAFMLPWLVTLLF